MPVKEIGKAAGVRYVLTGSVLAGGEKLRIDAQLADASTGAQMWSRSFDGELADLMGLQDQVTTFVANSIGDTMVINAARQSEKRRGNPSAMDLRLQARAVGLQRASAENLDRSEALLRQALALEPGDAPTELELAELLSRRAVNYDRGPRRQADRQRRFAEAHELAEKAAKTEPDDPIAYRILGRFVEEKRDVAEARRAYEKRLTLEPKSSSALSDLANTYMYDGPDGARRGVALLEKAAALEMNRPDAVTQMNLGEARFAAGDSAGAVDNLRMALQISPGMSSSHLGEPYLYLAMAYAELGDAEHLRELQALMKQDLLKRAAVGAPTSFFETFERSNSVDTPGYRTYRDNRLLPLWRKAGLPN
jgi:tetratricopeptide (TPR) repeat protein